MDKEKAINEIVAYLKKDRAVKKHLVGEIQVKKDNLLYPEIYVGWNSRKLSTATHVMNRVMEVYGDIVPNVGFYNGLAPHIIVPIKI